jgi:hypothetical protein
MRMPGNGYSPRLDGVLELPMAAMLDNQSPSLRFNYTNHFSDGHTLPSFRQHCTSKLPMVATQESSAGPAEASQSEVHALQPPRKVITMKE